ncbi:MAG: hypothetical protein ACXW1D_00325 [Halobacteriota archaeon]
MNKIIKTWQERVDPVDGSYKRFDAAKAEIADLRAYIAELEARPAATVDLTDYRAPTTYSNGTGRMPAAPVTIGAGDPEAVFASFCDREGYPSDGEMDVALRAAFYEGIKYCCVEHTPAAPVVAEGMRDQLRLIAEMQDADWPGQGADSEELSRHWFEAFKRKTGIAKALLAAHPVAGSPAEAEPVRTKAIHSAVLSIQHDPKYDARQRHAFLTAIHAAAAAVARFASKEELAASVEAEPMPASTCPECNGAKGHEKALSSTNYVWVPCIECSAAPVPASEAATLPRLYRFDRINKGRVMAEGIGVHAATMEEAEGKARKMMYDDDESIKFRSNDLCHKTRRCAVCSAFTAQATHAESNATQDKQEEDK